MNYKKKLDELFKKSTEQTSCPAPNKLAFLGEYIFDFTTYDSGIDELLASRMLEVVECILNRTTFEYQEEEENYLNYLLMVNYPFLHNKLEWGMSIRGAWFDEYGSHSDGGVYDICYIDDFNIPIKDINIFMKELIEWSKL